MEWYWALWIGIIIVSFAVMEWWAIKHNRSTLSLSIWELFKAWPLIAVIFGMTFGGLAVHFFWHWCPPGSISTG